MSGPIYGVGPPIPFPALTLEEKQKNEEKQARKQAAKEAKILKQKQKYDNREDGKTVASFFRRRKKRQSVVFDHSRRKSVDSADLINQINQIHTRQFPPNPNTNPLTQRLEARTEEHPMKDSERKTFVLPPYSRDQRSRSSNTSSLASRISSNAEEIESSLTKNPLKQANQVLSYDYRRNLRLDLPSVNKYRLESMSASEAQPFCLSLPDNPFNSPTMGAPDDFPGSEEQLQRFKSSFRKFESHSWQQQSSSSTLNEEIEGGQHEDLASNAPTDGTFGDTYGKLSEFAGRHVKGGSVGGDLADDTDLNLAPNPTAFDDERLTQFGMELVDTEDVDERRHRDIAYAAGQAGSGYHSQQFHDCQRWLENYTSGKYDVNKPPPRPPFGRTVQFLEAYLTDTEDERLKNASTFDQLWSEWKTETSSIEIQNALACFKCEKAVLCFFDGDYERIRMHNGLNLDKIERKISLAAHALYSRQVMVIHDTELDWRFKNNPLVTGGPRIRFIAAAPMLHHHDHTAVGVFYIYSPQPRNDFGPELRQSMANVAFKLLHDLFNQRADLVDPNSRKSSGGSSVERLSASSFMFPRPTSSYPVDKLIFSRENPSTLRFPKTAARRFSIATSTSSRNGAGSASTDILPQTSQIIDSERLAFPGNIDSSDGEHPTSNESSLQHSISRQDIDKVHLPSNLDEGKEYSVSNDGLFQAQSNIVEDFNGPSSIPSLADEERRFSFASSYRHTDVYGGANIEDSWAAEDEIRPVSRAGSFGGAIILRNVTADDLHNMTGEDFYEPDLQDDDGYDNELTGNYAGMGNMANDQAHSMLPSSLRIIKTPVQSPAAQFSASAEGTRYSDLQTRLSMMSFGAAEITADLSGVRRISDATETLKAHSGPVYTEGNEYNFGDPERDDYAAWYNEQPRQINVNLETPAQRKLNISKKLIKDQDDAGFYEDCTALFDTPITFRESSPARDAGHTAVAQSRHVFGMSKDPTHYLADGFPPLDNLRSSEWDSNGSSTRAVSDAPVVAGTEDLSVFDAPAPDGLQLQKIATIPNPGVSQDLGQGGLLSSRRELAVYRSLVNESPLKFNGGENPKRSAKSLCNPQEPLLLDACMIMSSGAQKLGFDLIYAAALRSPNSVTSDVDLVQGGLLDRDVIVAHGLKKKISVLHPGMHLAALRVGGLYTWDPPNRATRESQDFYRGYMMPIVDRPEDRFRTDGIVICAYRHSAGHGPFKSKRSDWIAFYNFVQNEIRPVMGKYEARRFGLPYPEPPRLKQQTLHDRTGREAKKRITVPENRPLPSLQELASSLSSRPSTATVTSACPSSATICSAFPAGEATEVQMYDRELRRYESVPDLDLRSEKQIENNMYLEQQVQASREQRERQQRLRTTRAADKERRRRLLAPDSVAHPRHTVGQREHQRSLLADAERREQLLALEPASHPEPTVERPRLVPRLRPVSEKKGLGVLFRSLGNR